MTLFVFACLKQLTYYFSSNIVTFLLKFRENNLTRFLIATELQVFVLV